MSDILLDKSESAFCSRVSFELQDSTIFYGADCALEVSQMCKKGLEKKRKIREDLLVHKASF